jgi:hypothetical protein
MRSCYLDHSRSSLRGLSGTVDLTVEHGRLLLGGAPLWSVWTPYFLSNALAAAT